MKKFMMKHLMINCKEATFLMCKKEEGKLSFTEKIKLSVHTSMCSFCKKFEKQSADISRESKHIHAEESMPSIVKEKIERLLDGYS
jgi:anti-sigma factor ChrR (cupin superfamily)